MFQSLAAHFLHLSVIPRNMFYLQLSDELPKVWGFIPLGPDTHQDTRGCPNLAFAPRTFLLTLPADLKHFSLPLFLSSSFHLLLPWTAPGLPAPNSTATFSDSPVRLPGSSRGRVSKGSSAPHCFWKAGPVPHRVDREQGSRSGSHMQVDSQADVWRWGQSTWHRCSRFNLLVYATATARDRSTAW